MIPAAYHLQFQIQTHSITRDHHHHKSSFCPFFNSLRNHHHSKTACNHNPSPPSTNPQPSIIHHHCNYLQANPIPPSCNSAITDNLQKPVLYLYLTITTLHGNPAQFPSP
jgi:hypothetical protein